MGSADMIDAIVSIGAIPTIIDAVCGPNRLLTRPSRASRRTGGSRTRCETPSPRATARQEVGDQDSRGDQQERVAKFVDPVGECRASRPTHVMYEFQNQGNSDVLKQRSSLSLSKRRPLARERLS